MAVTVVAKRLHDSYSQRELRVFVQYTLTGTYVTGGFVTPFTGVAGALGSNAVQSKSPIYFSWISPLGYIYATSIVTTAGVSVCTTKIFSAPGTELANGTTVPDAVVIAAIDAMRY